MNDKLEEVQEVYSHLLKTLNNLVSDHDPLIIAGCMMAQALTLYRTTLTEDDYERVIEGIVERKNDVKTFNGVILH